MSEIAVGDRTRTPAGAAALGKPMGQGRGPPERRGLRRRPHGRRPGHQPGASRPGKPPSGAGGIGTGTARSSALGTRPHTSWLLGWTWDGPREALKVAEDLDAASEGLPATRAAPSRMDPARARLDVGDREGAPESLPDAWAAAPQTARARPMARKAFRVLSSLHRRSNPGPLRLSELSGIPVRRTWTSCTDRHGDRPALPPAGRTLQGRERGHPGRLPGALPGPPGRTRAPMLVAVPGGWCGRTGRLPPRTRKR